MRLHALLSWYDEPIPSLVASLASLSDAGVDHVVAVDGAFALYPDGQAASHPNQHAAIALTCRELGMALTLHVPASPWPQNEPQKRTAMFALAWACAEEGDWFMVHDADMVVTRCPDDLKDRLAATEHDAAEVGILDVEARRAKQANWPERFAFRGFYRAQRITVGPSHCIYTGEHGSLWNGNELEVDAVPLDLTADVEIEHRPNQRPIERQTAKLGYYVNRDESGCERGDCATCGRPAVRLVAHNWRMSDIGPVAQWRECCEDHAEELTKMARVELEQLGIVPDSVVTENRNGRMPERVAVG